jgi:5-methyltetrahydropteroyltriglutamate--homocysteine methyltransferase
MSQSENRILTTHVGSLVRPERLVRSIQAIEDGVPVDMKAFDALTAESTVDVVKKQKAAGVDIVSDGEYGKFKSWSFYVWSRLEGLEQQDVGAPRGAGRDQLKFPEFYAEYFPKQKLPKRGTSVCVAPMKYVGQAAIATDIAHLKGAMKAAGVARGFLPVVAPASAVPTFRNDFYKSDEEFFFALADALREEYKAVVDAGLDVQVDDAFLPYMFDVAFKANEIDAFKKWASLRIDAVNHAIRGLPQERVRYHICWGSFNTPHTTDIDMRDIVDLVLRVKAGAYCIEMANPRHEHEWRVWETVKLPEGRKLVPGVIGHTSNNVEHPELVADRIVRLAKLVGRDNVMAGTDCGFSQTPLTPRVHESIQWAKLEALAEGARIATKQLWGK